MKRSLGARTIAFTTPVWVIGSYDDQGKPNIMTASWAGICCSRPPCVNVSLRKATYTYGCLMSRRAFTVSVPPQRYAREVDYIGLESGRKVDKFATTGLTAVKSNAVDAPYVGEFPLVLECKVIDTNEIGLHTMFIGEIVDVKADESVLNEKELPVIEKVDPFVFSPEIRRYNSLGGEIGKAFSIGRDFDKD
jgi:flavin reductase (DIM6/NTAB) family NADH-FMN oxidoreductase RutF